MQNILVAHEKMSEQTAYNIVEDDLREQRGSGRRAQGSDEHQAREPEGERVADSVASRRAQVLQGEGRQDEVSEQLALAPEAPPRSGGVFVSMSASTGGAEEAARHAAIAADGRRSTLTEEQKKRRGVSSKKKRARRTATRAGSRHFIDRARGHHVAVPSVCGGRDRAGLHPAAGARRVRADAHLPAVSRSRSASATA